VNAAALLGLPGVEPLPEGHASVDVLRSAVRGESEAPESVPSLAAALVAVVPDALERHDALGVPRGVTEATLADVGGKIDAYGATVDVPWLVGLMRGDVLGLGRLQFERETTDEGRAIHIPEGVSLRPDLVDASLAEARAVFGDGTLICTSWLLDPALLQLPATSNIVAFARRFDVEPADPGHEGDEAAAKFVFRRPLSEVLDPAIVTPRTTLERLVADHLRSGRHWSEPRGTLRP
jgi:hypothetical protein